MIRVSDDTRRRVQKLGREEFGGASADETIQRLLDEHWERTVVEAVHRTRQEEPEDWAAYIAEAKHTADAQAPVPDEASE
ncbi:hypothetical protein GCM10027174_44280 [Salinifilum aidingensis]